MKFGAVLWDLDGTLVDSAAGITAAVQGAAAALKLPEPTAERVRASVGDGVHNLLLRCFPDLAKGRTPAGCDLNAVLAVYDREYERSAGALTRAYAGIAELLAALPRERCALISNKAEAHCRRILDALQLTQHFACISGGDTHAERKPSALPLLAACKALGVAPADAIMVGDGPQDLRAARNAQVRSCAVLWGFGSESALRAMNPDFVARDVSALREHLGIA